MDRSACSVMVGLLLAACLAITGCSRPVEPKAPAPNETQPLRLQRSFETTASNGEPVAVLDLEMYRTTTQELAIEATMTNVSEETFTTSADELMIVGEYERFGTLYGPAPRSTFGGPNLEPGDTRVWSIRVPAPPNGVTIHVTNWFVPLPGPPGAMVSGSFEVTSALIVIPVLVDR